MQIRPPPFLVDLIIDIIDFLYAALAVTQNLGWSQRNRDLQPLIHPTPSPQELPHYLMLQHQADQAIQISQAKILTGFDEGKVTICGITYVYDIRTFNKKQHDMHFTDGRLEVQTSE